MKIFIFRIYYKDKIMGQAIHRKAKGCLVRFANEPATYLSHNQFKIFFISKPSECVVSVPHAFYVFLEEHAHIYSYPDYTQFLN